MKGERKEGSKGGMEKGGREVKKEKVHKMPLRSLQDWVAGIWQACMETGVWTQVLCKSSYLLFLNSKSLST